MWLIDKLFNQPKDKYTAKEAGSYYSERYGKHVSWPKGYQSNGADIVPDLSYLAFFTHDRLCQRTTWDCGTPVTNWQASSVYFDILKEKGHWQAYHRWLGTFIGGGNKLKRW